VLKILRSSGRFLPASGRQKGFWEILHFTRLTGIASRLSPAKTDKRRAVSHYPTSLTGLENFPVRRLSHSFSAKNPEVFCRIPTCLRPSEGLCEIFNPSVEILIFKEIDDYYKILFYYYYFNIGLQQLLVFDYGDNFKSILSRLQSRK
jgi:hypothetical protein